MRTRRKDYRIYTGGEIAAEKYNNNLIYSRLNQGFMDSLLSLVRETGKTRIFEVGCGEGQLLGVLHEQGYDVSGMDIDPTALKIAKNNTKHLKKRFRGISQGNVFELNRNDVRIEGAMLICCEVLEHVSEPEKAIQIIANCTDKYFIVSVPHEPIWRILNIARGKYLKDFGNTPGHINHWTKTQFVKLIQKYGQIIDVRAPLPWTMILAKTKNIN